MKHLFLSAFIFFSSLLVCQNTTGFNLQKTNSQQGYILFAPLHSTTTYLIDKCGRQVHNWKSAYMPGQSVYLLPNGDLLRTAKDTTNVFKGGGRIERFNWDNKLVWYYSLSSATECQHHDICPLPNGNILVLMWEKKSRQDALTSGRNPALVKDCLWSEKIIELKPSGKNSAKIVWEWHAWDHLVQEYDSLKNNYGVVAKNRQLININYATVPDADWLHFNSIAYNAKFDQVLVSNRNYSEIFVLDHSTSLGQAASHRGGNYNKGGDLLYRFGNPAAYNGGPAADEVLFGQHDAKWIEAGLKDENKIMLFNNGMGRRNEMYSSVDIISPPIDSLGRYDVTEKTVYKQVYSERQDPNMLGGVFYSPNVSSAQRLSNGNTLVCSGASGQFCELDENNNIVWLYVNPVTNTGIARGGALVNRNEVFRCSFFEPTFKAFKGRDLKPVLTIDGSVPKYECFSVPEKK